MRRHSRPAVWSSVNVGLLLMLTTVHCHDLHKRQAINVQNPPVWQALDVLRGSTAPNAADVQRLMASAVPGQSYPTLSYIPQTSFTCSSVRQPGFYADPETGCQVFRRCEANNYMFSYICPNSTLYNQITLVCDYWYNVQCQASNQFVDYSNPRIYNQNARLLDDVDMGGASGNFIDASGGGIGIGGGGGGVGGSGGRYTGGQLQQGGSGSLIGGGGSSLIGGGGAILISGGGSGNSVYSGTGSGQSTGLYGSGQSGSSGLYQQSGLQSGGGTYQSSNQGSAGALYGSGQASTYGRGTSGYASSQPVSSNSGAYTGTFLGSYSPSQQVQQQQQQLPFGTQLSSSYPARQPAQYQSAGQQTYAQQPATQFQQPVGYAGQQQQYTSSLQQPSYAVSQGGPSYRSLSNRLLRLQADASERVSDIVTTQVSAPTAESKADVL